MRTAFTKMLLLITLIVSSLPLFAQDAYRTDLSAKGGQWTNAANWQRFDAVTNQWVSAEHYPTYLDGTITIQAGDSLQLFGAGHSLFIDQVIIEKGASLVLLKNDEKAIAINDGAGDDIVVNGGLYVQAEGAVHGKGNIIVNKEGVLVVKNNGFVGVPVVNNGLMRIEGSGQTAGVFSGATILNNRTCVWSNGNVFMDSSSVFINNGRLEIATAMNISLSNLKLSTGRIINKGIILNASKEHTVDFNVKMDNQGTLGGVGTFLFSGGLNSGGVISPGASPGHLTLGAGVLKSPVINIEIATTGAIAGLHYDQLTVTSFQDLNGAVINVTDAANDSVNTEYVIIDAAKPDMRKPYPELTIYAPGNFSWEFRGNKLLLKKIAAEALPVSWGGFRAVATNGKVLLDWNAARDKRTACFIVEHSTNATDYVPVAKMPAQQGEAGEAQYSFLFAGADLLKTNYFRIKQVNTDGRSGYSVSRSIRFDKGQVIALQAHADVENDEIQLNIQTENVRIYLNDHSGMAVQQFELKPGQHTIYMETLPAGIYRLSIFVKDVMVETKQFVKR